MNRINFYTNNKGEVEFCDVLRIGIDFTVGSVKWTLHDDCGWIARCNNVPLYMTKNNTLPNAEEHAACLRKSMFIHKHVHDPTALFVNNVHKAHFANSDLDILSTGESYPVHNLGGGAMLLYIKHTTNKNDEHIKDLLTETHASQACVNIITHSVLCNYDALLIDKNSPVQRLYLEEIFK